MSKNNIILLGPSGAGKSSTARLLSAALDCPCIDCDTLIEESAGQSIKEIFEQKGESAFRLLENQLLESLLTTKDEFKVIACGGGLPIANGNIEKLRRLGQTIFLTASPDTLAQRIGTKKDRPLLASDDLQGRIAGLLASRLDIYQQAHMTIDTEGKTVEQVVVEIQRILTNTTL